MELRLSFVTTLVSISVERKPVMGVALKVISRLAQVTVATMDRLRERTVKERVIAPLKKARCCCN